MHDSAFREELFRKLYEGFPPKKILYTMENPQRWKGDVDQLTRLSAKERAKWPAEAGVY